MHTFFETLNIAGGFAAAIVAAVVALTLFFRSVVWMFEGAKPDAIAPRAILKENTRATVHVAGKPPFERVRLLGFTNAETVKTHWPYELNGMVILEDERQTRFFVRAKDIKMIVAPPDEEAAEQAG